MTSLIVSAPYALKDVKGVADSITVNQHSYYNNNPDIQDWLLIIDSSCEGLVIDELRVIGTASEYSKEDWIKTVANGVLCLAPSVTIKSLYLELLHVGLESRTNGLVIESWQARKLSGDVLQGDSSKVTVKNGMLYDLLQVFDFKKYHPDVVQWRGKVFDVLFDDIEVFSSYHPWARQQYQGLMFSDGIFTNCHVSNLKFPNVHPEHAVTFSEAHYCTVKNVAGGGAVRFRSLNGSPSTNCTACNIDGVVEGGKAITMDNKAVGIFNPIEQFGLDANSITVGILFNNPCNIKKFENWHGEVDPRNLPVWMTPVRRRDLLRFTDPVFGIRAAAHILLGYQRKHNLNSVAKIISRWSPATGADADNTKQETANYINHVASRVGIAANATIALTDYKTIRPMIVAMIEFENGYLMPYSNNQIDTALAMAGIKLPEETPIETKPASQSMERKGSILVGAGGALGAGTGATIYGVTQEQAQVIVDAVGNTAKVVASTSDRIDLLLWLSIFNSLAFAVLIVGAVMWYIGRKRAADMGLR